MVPMGKTEGMLVWDGGGSIGAYCHVALVAGEAGTLIDSRRRPT